MQDILKRMPGMGGGLLDQMDDELLETQEQMMDKFSIMMNSMTEKEMQNPDIIKSSRIERIAKGSGTDIEEVEQMLSQYDQMRGFFGQIDGKGDIKKMADRFDLGGGIGPF
jgi:signal recognition particle subunit SRP54